MLVWMDLEMTGLDPTTDVIVEIATLVTDDELEIVAEGPDLVIATAADKLVEMDPVVRDMHTRSGLLKAIEASTVSLEDGIPRAVEWFKEHRAAHPEEEGPLPPDTLFPQDAELGWKSPVSS